MTTGGEDEPAVEAVSGEVGGEEGREVKVRQSPLHLLVSKRTVLLRVELVKSFRIAFRLGFDFHFYGFYIIYL